MSKDEYIIAKREIRAVYNADTIRVYQAYSDVIADEAVVKGNFGEHFKLNRMTWIKPSFLWMMYRCGWASKPGQERVLAIDIKRDAFDHIVKSAVLSTYNPERDGSMEEWKRKIQNSDIRCQWDPERDIWGNPLDYRSIQLGLRGQAVFDYVNDWIVRIKDITAFVKELDDLRHTGVDISEKLPRKKIYIASII